MVAANLTGSGEFHNFPPSNVVPEPFSIAGLGPTMTAAALEQNIHSHVTLSVDGEKLAEAHSTAKRSSALRSFREAPVSDGGY